MLATKTVCNDISSGLNLLDLNWFGVFSSLIVRTYHSSCAHIFNSFTVEYATTHQISIHILFLRPTLERLRWWYMGYNWQHFTAEAYKTFCGEDGSLHLVEHNSPVIVVHLCGYIIHQNSTGDCHGVCHYNDKAMILRHWQVYPKKLGHQTL